MIGGWKESDIVDEIERAFYFDTFDFTRYFPGHIARKESDMRIFATGVPADVLNGVLGPRMDERTMSSRIAEVMNHFKPSRIPMTWFLGPSSGPEGLENALAEQGMVPGAPIPSMAIDLETLEAPDLPSHIQVEEVTDQETLKVCSRTRRMASNCPRRPPTST